MQLCSATHFSITAVPKVREACKQGGLQAELDARENVLVLPLAQLDHVYARGLTPVSLHVPRGRIWWRMSDHLPLVAELVAA